MVFFNSATASSVVYCGTAQRIQEELRRIRINHLSILQGVQVVVHYMPNSLGVRAFTLTFIGENPMSEEKKKCIRDIVLGDDLKKFFSRTLAERHDWSHFRTYVSSRENPNNYVWSVERRG